MGWRTGSAKLTGWPSWTENSYRIRYCWPNATGWQMGLLKQTGWANDFRCRWRSGTPMHSHWDFRMRIANTTPIRCWTENSYRIRCCWLTATGWQMGLLKRTGWPSWTENSYRIRCCWLTATGWRTDSGSETHFLIAIH